jgi:hypothetical protein
LADKTWYFWRVRATDEHGAAGDWMPPAAFMVNQNGIDDPPRIVLQEPARDLFLRDGTILIRWEDGDPDSNAEISLSFAPAGGAAPPTGIADGIPEDPDSADDTSAWEVSSLPEGAYRITATISDATSTHSSTAPGTVTIDRTAPTVQAAPPGATCSAAQTVTLAANEPATIYYTLDGSAPTASSPQYTGPIAIKQTTTLTFLAVDRAGNASPVQTAAYTLATATRYWLYGAGRNHPQPEGYKAQFTFLATGPANPQGWLTYQCPRARVQLVSTAITGVAVSGHTATLTGAGRVHGVPGYRFTATAVNGSPERFAITITKPNGSLYYRAAPTRLEDGELWIVPLD